MTRKAQYTRLHFIHSQAQHNSISFTLNVQTFKYTYLLQSLPVQFLSVTSRLKPLFPPWLACFFFPSAILPFVALSFQLV